MLKRALVFTLLAITASVAKADAIYFVQAQSGASIGPLTSSGSQTNSGSTTVTTSSSQGEGLQAIVAPNFYLSPGGSATAGPNDLGVYAAVTATASGITTLPAPYSGMQEDAILTFASAEADLKDTLLLTNAPTQGYLAIYTQLDGSMFVYGQGTYPYPSGAVELSGLSNGARSCDVLNAGSLSYSCTGFGLLSEGTNTLLIPYTLNPDGTVPFELELFTEAMCNPEYDTYNKIIATCNVTSDFSHTAQVEQIVVEDANGNPVSGAFATSVNGVDYSLPPDPTGVTPEPSTLLMLGSGLIGVVGAVKRRLTA